MSIFGDLAKSFSEGASGAIGGASSALNERYGSADYWRSQFFGGGGTAPTPSLPNSAYIQSAGGGLMKWVMLLLIGGGLVWLVFGKKKRSSSVRTARRSSASGYKVVSASKPATKSGNNVFTIGPKQSQFSNPSTNARLNPRRSKSGIKGVPANKYYGDMTGREKKLFNIAVANLKNSKKRR